MKKFFKPSSAFVTLLIDETGIYAATTDVLCRLDLGTGSIVWQKQLDSKNWFGGAGVASIATLGSGAGLAAQAQDYQRRANDGGGA